MKARKLLSISGAAVITFLGGAASATGNLMAPQPRPDPQPKPGFEKSVDAGTAADAAVPLQKGEAKKEVLKKDAAKQ